MSSVREDMRIQFIIIFLGSGNIGNVPGENWQYGDTSTKGGVPALSPSHIANSCQDNSSGPWT
jgi:hypothetical protein